MVHHLPEEGELKMPGQPPAIYKQSSFVGGMNQQVDATRIGDSEYFLLINGRNRYDTIDPLRKARLLTSNIIGLPLGEETYQGVYGAGNFVVVFVGGAAYFRNVVTSSNFQKIVGLQMSADVPRIFAEFVPASTLGFIRKSSTNINDPIDLELLAGQTPSPVAMVVQDGVNQPWVIFPDGTARVTHKYSDWTIADREYVPVGRQMLYSGGILYIVSQDGNRILRMVSGRPLDGMVNIDSSGNKEAIEIEGNADTVSIPIDFDQITCIGRLNTTDGSFFVSTTKNSYMVTPILDRLVFGEPTYRITYLFNTGAVSQFSMIDILGDSALIDFGGIRSFNSVMQTQNEGRNLPFYAKISRLFKNQLQTADSCAINFDDFGLFSVMTVYGPCVIVYDTINRTYTGIDQYEGVGLIKQFCEIKTSLTNRRLFFITVDNLLYEAFPSEGTEFEVTKLFVGEWCSNDPSVEQKPQDVKLVFTNVEGEGIVNTQVYVDRVFNESKFAAIKQDGSPSLDGFPVVGTFDKDIVKNVNLSLDECAQGWKVGMFISWNFGASLTHVKIESATYVSDTNTEQEAAALGQAS